MTLRSFRIFAAKNFTSGGTLLRRSTVNGLSYELTEMPLPESAYAELLYACREELLKQKTCFVFPYTKPPDLAFFDMDATVIAEESLVELARAAGTEKKVAEITERAMAGEIDFKEALTARVSTLKGLPQSILATTLEHLTLQDGMTELTGFLQEVGCAYHLVSGGFKELAQPIADRLGFSSIHANTLVTKDGLLTGTCGANIVDGQAKAAYVKQIRRSFSTSQPVILAVGDGANDRSMMAEASLAFGYRPKAALIPCLNGGIFSGDHRLIREVLRA